MNVGTSWAGFRAGLSVQAGIDTLSVPSSEVEPENRPQLDRNWIDLDHQLNTMLWAAQRWEDWP